MMMIVGGARKVANPTDQEIRTALESFDAKKVKNSEAFVVLEIDRMNFMQVSGEKDLGFDAEFQEGELKLHYRARRADFSLVEILAMLCAYRDGRPDWRGMAEWEIITF